MQVAAAEAVVLGLDEGPVVTGQPDRGGSDVEGQARPEPALEGCALLACRQRLAVRIALDVRVDRHPAVGAQLRVVAVGVCGPVLVVAVVGMPERDRHVLPGVGRHRVKGCVERQPVGLGHDRAELAEADEGRAVREHPAR